MALNGGCSRQLGGWRQDRALGQGRTRHDRHPHLDDTSHRPPRQDALATPHGLAAWSDDPADWLTVYRPDGRKRLRVLDGKQITTAQAVGDYLYADTAYSRPGTRSISVPARSQEGCAKRDDPRPRPRRHSLARWRHPHRSRGLSQDVPWRDGAADLPSPISLPDVGAGCGGANTGGCRRRFV